MSNHYLKLIPLCICMFAIGCITKSAEEKAEGPVSYKCDSGKSISVVYDLDSASVLISGIRTELLQKRTASGFYYSNDSMSIRGKGNELMLIQADASVVHCYGQNRRN